MGGIRMAEQTKLSGEKAMKRKPEEIVLEDIIIPFLRKVGKIIRYFPLV